MSSVGDELSRLARLIDDALAILAPIVQGAFRFLLRGFGISLGLAIGLILPVVGALRCGGPRCLAAAQPTNNHHYQNSPQKAHDSLLIGAPGSWRMSVFSVRSRLGGMGKYSCPWVRRGGSHPHGQEYLPMPPEQWLLAMKRRLCQNTYGRKVLAVAVTFEHAID